MIQITSDLRIDDRDISERFVRSIGSRSQNVRKEATAVELRLDIGKGCLPLEKAVMTLGGRHVTADGVLIVVSRANRSWPNRRAARARLVVLLKRAAAAPKRGGRQSTVRTAERRTSKQQHSALKRSRPDETRVRAASGVSYEGIREVK
jgi:ribosome-associated protein